MENIDSKSVYKCPVCELNLIKQEKQYICDKGHSFDISGNGYINLLLVNQKKTKDPGDSRSMMESRRNFLNKEYYSNFSNGLNMVVNSYLSNTSRYILDAGCGEGYFISKLKNYLSTKEYRENITYYGIDISKSAIKYASKRDENIYFSIGSNFKLPIMDNTIDCIIRNFAPGDNVEFHRVLKETGKLIIVTPGIEHLFELKEILYDKARKHDEKDSTLEGFKCVEHKEIKYSIIAEEQEDIKNLISMTPYYWSITNEMRNTIDQISSLKTMLHFNIDVYSKTYI